MNIKYSHSCFDNKSITPANVIISISTHFIHNEQEYQLKFNVDSFFFYASDRNGLIESIIFQILSILENDLYGKITLSEFKYLLDSYPEITENLKNILESMYLKSLI